MLYSVCACDKPLPCDFPFPLRGEYEECAAYAGELGFDGIELQIQDPRGYSACRLQAVAQRHGLRFSAITTGLAHTFEGLSMTDNDPEIRARTLTRLRQQLELAKALDTNILLGIIRGRMHPGESEESFEAKLTDSMLRLLEHAEAIGGGVIFEHINRRDGDVYNSTERTMRFIEQLASNRLFYNADTYHMLTEDPHPTQAIARSVHKLELFHVSDADRALPDDRHFDFRQAAQSLREHGYNRWLTLECRPLPDTHTATRAGIDYLRRVFPRTGVPA